MATKGDQARARELAAGLAKKLRDTQLRVDRLREQLDELLFDWHQDGCSIADLARTAEVSRQSVYNSIERHRSRIAR
jgi:Mor family transcriptional regulator